MFHVSDCQLLWNWNATKLAGWSLIHFRVDAIQIKLGQMRFILAGTSLARINKDEIIFNLPKLFQVQLSSLRIVVDMMLSSKFCLD